MALISAWKLSWKALIDRRPWDSGYKLRCFVDTSNIRLPTHW